MSGLCFKHLAYLEALKVLEGQPCRSTTTAELAYAIDAINYIPIQINTVENKPQTEDSTGEEA